MKLTRTQHAARKKAERLQFLMDYTVVRIGTEPVRYALARDDKNLTIVGPLRSTKKAAWAAGRKVVMGE